MALYFSTHLRIFGTSYRNHFLRACSSISKYSRSGFWYVNPASRSRRQIVFFETHT